jgi:hypothetical protein
VSNVGAFVWQAEDRLASYGDGSLKFWQLRDPPLSRAGTMVDNQFVFSPCGNWHFALNDKVRLFNRKTGKVEREWATDVITMQPVFRKDGRKVAVFFGKVNKDTRVHYEMVVFDSGTWKEEARLPPEVAAIEAKFAADGRLYVLGGHMNLERDVIWSVDANRVLWQLPADHQGAFFTPDGSGIVISQDRTNVILAELTTGKKRAEFNKPADESWGTFSPDGRWLSMICDAGLIMRRFPSFEQRFPITGGHEHSFSKDSRLLAHYHSKRREVSLWDLERGEELFRWPTEKFSVAFTPEGDLACGELQGSQVQVIRLESLRRQLAEMGLGW